MALFRTTEPAIEPVSLVEARRHLRLDDESEDVFLEALIRAARQEVENATGLALIKQHWRLTLDRLPHSGLVSLHKHPVVQVLSVTVYGADGEAGLVAPGDYVLDPHSRPARLHFSTAPTSALSMNGIEIDFSAGFGQAGADVPDLIRRAMLMLVAHWYEFRLSFGAADQPASYPSGYDRLIAGYRLRRL